MKTILLLAALLWSQMATAKESAFIDDAPKGFIHVTEERFGAEVHNYLRANTVTRLEQFSEENDGKMGHFLWLHTTGVVGALGNTHAGVGQIGSPKFLIQFASKEEADKVRKRLLEILSAKE
jgi:hypothetical protein